jgi:hypothetical protein
MIGYSIFYLLWHNKIGRDFKIGGYRKDISDGTVKTRDIPVYMDGVFYEVRPLNQCYPNEF